MKALTPSPKFELMKAGVNRSEIRCLGLDQIATPLLLLRGEPYNTSLSDFFQKQITPSRCRPENSRLDHPAQFSGTVILLFDFRVGNVLLQTSSRGSMSQRPN